MNRIKYFIISAVLITPFILFQLYLANRYGRPIDISKFINDIDYYNFITGIRNFFAVISIIIFLFISHLRVKYIGLKGKSILFLIIPFINILFFIYLLFGKKDIKKITS